MRFYLPNVKNGPSIVLTGDAHTHAAYALRIRVGDQITVFDGMGNDYSCQVEEIKKDKTLLRVIDTARNVGEPELDVTLYLAVIKQDTVYDYLLKLCHYQTGILSIIMYTPACARWAWT